MSLNCIDVVLKLGTNVEGKYALPCVYLTDPVLNMS